MKNMTHFCSAVVGILSLLGTTGCSTLFAPRVAVAWMQDDAPYSIPLRETVALRREVEAVLAKENYRLALNPEDGKQLAIVELKTNPSGAKKYSVVALRKVMRNPDWRPQGTGSSASNTALPLRWEGEIFTLIDNANRLGTMANEAALRNP